MSLIVLGTVALDDIKTASGDKPDLLGGSATHFAMSASLFTNVHLAAIIGRDFPKKHIQLLRKKGVDLSSLVEQDGQTFHWKGEYKQGDYNTAITLATELGVLVNYAPRLTEQQRMIPHVFLANFDPDIQMKFLRLMNKPRLVGLDSMNLWINTKRKSVEDLMKRVDLFVANDGEARALTGRSNLIQAARQLRRMGPRYVVIKKGEHGVLFYCDEFMFSFPAFPVEKVIDPTGAGDTFAGGLMGYLSTVKQMNAKTFKKAILYATITASFNVEGFAVARTSSLTLDAVHQRMKRYLQFATP